MLPLLVDRTESGWTDVVTLSSTASECRGHRLSPNGSLPVLHPEVKAGFGERALGKPGHPLGAGAGSSAWFQATDDPFFGTTLPDSSLKPPHGSGKRVLSQGWREQRREEWTGCGLPRPPKAGPGVGIPPQTNVVCQEFLQGFYVRGRQFSGWTGKGLPARGTWGLTYPTCQSREKTLWIGA
uniref:Uncharacterized protein n=1 Tax=Myotis myotis TaxID=51298 RepID=A0A7J7XH89_MYOMY|nr:hypothetical protein mMyoMyo1_011639 [Myotis myotis]